VEALLYATIWSALALFVLAEIGRGPLADGVRPASWVRFAYIAGALLAVGHAILVFHLRYDWNHETAVRETARQGAALYGVEFRGGLYLNYLFIALWLVAGWRWTHWLWRGFVLLMIVNGAVVFVRPAARPLGAALVALLIWAWRRPPRLAPRGLSRPS
jgi:hypothetical protein